MTQQLLTKIMYDREKAKPFALLYRPHITGREIVEVMVGDIVHPLNLQSIPIVKNANLPYSTLTLIPYNQLKEREFAHVDDQRKLLAMVLSNYEMTSMQDVLSLIPTVPIELVNSNFDLDDDAYANIVRKIVNDEIGHGAGSNFVIKRQFIADISDYSIDSALSVFRHLLQNETGAYWTFIIHSGDHTFVGASPELHISLNNGVAMMNPISGTYRYPATGPTLAGMLNFLATHKETDELFMVVEEELKMMSRFCHKGGKVFGPFLKEMSRLAHTEYFVQGNTSADPRAILRDTLFAPTVTGSPIENACRVIKKHEPLGRGFYSGIGALLGHDDAGNYSLDSTILIRTADIDKTGHVRIGVGSTIVRHSDPIAESKETRAKAHALLTAMNVGVAA